MKTVNYNHNIYKSKYYNKQSKLIANHIFFKRPEERFTLLLQVIINLYNN